MSKKLDWSGRIRGLERRYNYYMGEYKLKNRVAQSYLNAARRAALELLEARESAREGANEKSD